MFKHESMFFFAALFFLFLLWVASGGPTHPISFAGPFLNAPAPLGDGRAYFLPGAGFKISSMPTAGYSVSDNSDFHLNYDNNGSNAVDPALYGELSPYHGQVFFSSGSTGAIENIASYEYLMIRVGGGSAADIPVTGWRVISARTGNSATIGTGAIVPVNQIMSGGTPIVMHVGDVAYLNTGSSPLGISFRENECTGYLDQYQRYNPHLNKFCPAAFDEYRNVYDVNNINTNSCEDFVRSLHLCEAVDETVKTYQKESISTTCSDFALTHFNYNSCLINHKNDNNFAGTTWRIFFGRNAQLWNQPHDVIKLVDANGKTVDILSY